MSFPAIQIQFLIEDALRNKIKKFNPESGNKPIHERLLGKDRMVLFSIIHSISTSIGTSIYEPVAKEIAKYKFETADTQVKLSGEFTTEAQSEINQILLELNQNSIRPHQQNELERIRSKCRAGKVQSKKMTKVDVYLADSDKIYLIDIKTAKPNKGDVEGYKRRLLEWVAAKLYEDPSANIVPIIGIPYNPYYPEPYKRWTMQNYLDDSRDGQLLVAEEFWNFLAGGENVYEELLECFEIVGKNMRDELDQFVKTNMVSHPHRDVSY